MKQQRILVCSDQRQSAAELPLRRGDRYRLTHCARDDQGIDVTGRMQQRYDWILFEGALMDGDQMELVRSLRAMGLLFPESGRGGCNYRSCRVEWSPNGILELHCGRRGGCGDTPPDRPDKEAEGYVFEYHAPMKRTG